MAGCALTASWLPAAIGWHDQWPAAGPGGPHVKAARAAVGCSRTALLPSQLLPHAYLGASLAEDCPGGLVAVINWARARGISSGGLQATAVRCVRTESLRVQTALFQKKKGVQTANQTSGQRGLVVDGPKLAEGAARCPPE